VTFEKLKTDEARKGVNGESRGDGTRERGDGAAFRTRPAGEFANGCPEWAVAEHLPLRGDGDGGPIGQSKEQRRKGG